MNHVIVAGATGYLGQYIVKALQVRKIPFKAIGRNADKLLKIGINQEQIIEAEVTKPETLQGILKTGDKLISTVGITRQKDGMTYEDVDYQANINLLNEAKKVGVSQFMYVSVINGNSLRHLKITDAKERFVDALTNSGLNYCIVRPNGFFSDLSDFSDMAKNGKVYLFGHGEYMLNPIHGSDLADAMVDSLENAPQEIVIGGPDILTQNEIAEMALKAWGKPIKIFYLPDWVRRLSIKVLRVLTPLEFYGPYEFFLTMMAQDNIAPRYGVERVDAHFRKLVAANRN